MERRQMDEEDGSVWFETDCSWLKTKSKRRNTCQRSLLGQPNSNRTLHNFPKYT